MLGAGAVHYATYKCCSAVMKLFTRTLEIRQSLCQVFRIDWDIVIKAVNAAVTLEASVAFGTAYAFDRHNLDVRGLLDARGNQL